MKMGIREHWRAVVATVAKMSVMSKELDWCKSRNWGSVCDTLVGGAGVDFLVSYSRTTQCKRWKRNTYGSYSSDRRGTPPRFGGDVPAMAEMGAALGVELALLSPLEHSIRKEQSLKFEGKEQKVSRDGCGVEAGVGGCGCGDGGSTQWPVSRQHHAAVLPRKEHNNIRSTP